MVFHYTGRCRGTIIMMITEVTKYFSSAPQQPLITSALKLLKVRFHLTNLLMVQVTVGLFWTSLGLYEPVHSRKNSRESGRMG